MPYLAIGLLITLTLAAVLVAVGVIGTLRADEKDRKGYMVVSLCWGGVLIVFLVLLGLLAGWPGLTKPAPASNAGGTTCSGGQVWNGTTNKCEWLDEALPVSNPKEADCQKLGPNWHLDATEGKCVLGVP